MKPTARIALALSAAATAFALLSPIISSANNGGGHIDVESEWNCAAIGYGPSGGPGSTFVQAKPRSAALQAAVRACRAKGWKRCRPAPASCKKVKL